MRDNGGADSGGEARSPSIRNDDGGSGVAALNLKLLAVLVAALVVGIDQATKAWAVERLAGGGGAPALPGLPGLVLATLGRRTAAPLARDLRHGADAVRDVIQHVKPGHTLRFQQTRGIRPLFVEDGGQNAAVGHAGMVNFIGDMPPLAEVLAIRGAHYHDYGKTARPNRKLGHCTVVRGTAAERDEALRRLAHLADAFLLQWLRARGALSGKGNWLAE